MGLTHCYKTTVFLHLLLIIHHACTRLSINVAHNLQCWSCLQRYTGTCYKRQNPPNRKRHQQLLLLSVPKNGNCTTSKTASKIRLRIYVIRNILASNKRQLWQATHPYIQTGARIVKRYCRLKTIKAHPVDRPVRLLLPLCTDTVVLIFPFLQTNITSQTWPSGREVSRFHEILFIVLLLLLNKDDYQGCSSRFNAENWKTYEKINYSWRSPAAAYVQQTCLPWGLFHFSRSPCWHVENTVMHAKNSDR